MTPLAHRIANELTMPVKARTFRDQCGLLDRFDDVHCFDVSDVFDMAGDLAETEFARGRTIDILAFLPAPRTWIEWRYSDGSREGVLLESSDGEVAEARWAIGGAALFLSAQFVGRLKLKGDGRAASEHYVVRRLKGETEAAQRGWIVLLYALLAMINTPRIIGRTTHMPHSGLQRKLAKARGMVGKFPLHAWTEIKLDVGPPKVSEGDQEIRLSGRKALHFVRSHLRVRRGLLELVSAHWRGDPALGIKQSRYKLVA